MKNKLVLVKTQPIAKKNQLQFKEDPENNAENKEIKSKNPKENIEKNKKKEEEKIETLSEVKIVETSSMEELSVCFIFPLYIYINISFFMFFIICKLSTKFFFIQ